jgi:surfeit locus 1 family protein
MSYQFKPTRFTNSLFLLLILGFSGVGIWQIFTAPKSASLPLTGIANDALEPLSLNMPFEEFAPYQKAQATGHYRAKNSILLDNITYEGKPGYHLITPFEIMASRAVILVNRGWLPKTSSIDTLPDFKTPEGLITLSGYLSHPQTKPAFLHQSNPLSVTPPVWYYLDLNFFSQINGYSVLPLILKLNPGGQTSTLSSTSIPAEETEATLIQDGQIDTQIGKWHKSDSLQWFLYALFSLLFYIFTGIKKIKQTQ